MSEWIGVIRPTRPGFVDEPAERESAAMSEHFQRLTASLDEGRLIVAGPAVDGADTFGIIVFEAEDAEAAQRYMDDDPAVRAGVVAATVHPFRVSLLRGRPPPE